MQTVKDIKEQLKEKYKNKEFVTDKTGVKTVELISSSFIADDNHILREPNEDYIKREIAWYKSESLYVEDIPGKTPEIWEKVSSKHGRINSNYGWCIHSVDNSSQYYNVVDELTHNKDSRRAEMIYTRPSMHYEFDTDGMSDFMCTEVVQYLIRNDKLQAIVKMRSNDAVFGFNNDYAWQKYVLEELAKELDVLPGNIYWNAGSLHVYERHFDLLL